MIHQAICNLSPGSEWTISGDDTYDNIQWLNVVGEIPTQQAVQAEIVRLREQYVYDEYKRHRAVEYPDFKMYLDGVVKGDQAQIDAYIAACQAVKNKYPKPE